MRESESEEEESEADVNGGRSSYAGTAGAGARVGAASECGGSQKASLTEIHAPEGGMMGGEGLWEGSWGEGTATLGAGGLSIATPRAGGSVGG